MAFLTQRGREHGLKRPRKVDWKQPLPDGGGSETPGRPGGVSTRRAEMRASRLTAMMKTPRFEGDQEVNITESNLTDAAKGNGNVPLLAFWGCGAGGESACQRHRLKSVPPQPGFTALPCGVLRDQVVARGPGDPPYPEDLWI
jgi:hypothetical protein